MDFGTYKLAAAEKQRKAMSLIDTVHDLCV